MSNLIRILLFSLYVILGLIIEGFILWLFPFTGIAGLVCWPIAIFLSLGFGYVLIKLTKKSSNVWRTLGVFFVLIIFQSFVQLVTTPQESGVFLTINDTKNAYYKFDKIEVNDFPNLSRGERVVYIYKFKSNLPSSFITLTIDSLKNDDENTNPRVYLIKNIKGKKHFDKNKINIVESDTATLITEYYNKTDTSVYKMNRNFMNIGSGGYNDRVISIFIHEDNLKFNSGMEILLYKILSWTKNANH
ncbi:MAG TPA: hypothetical protein VLZ83_13450 [Edaphocola sp.]|nr:hypothetical protein [Edaphocola sp.]